MAKEFRKLVERSIGQQQSGAKKRRIKLPGKIHRPGLGFYAFRHTFETIGGESRDQVAVNHIMGHADVSMAGRLP